MALTPEKRAELDNGIYDDWSEAFDVCREADQPLTVREVKETGQMGKWTVFPSGHCKNLITKMMEVDMRVHLRRTYIIDGEKVYVPMCRARKIKRSQKMTDRVLAVTCKRCMKIIEA